MSQNRLLECPVCAAQMKVVNRGGVHIDRCTGCKGIYLDNGEIEKIITLMSTPEDDDAWLQPPTRKPRPAPTHETHYHHSPYAYGKKPRSALKTFMDIFD